MQESQHRRKSSIKKHPATATMISKQPLLSHIFSHNRKKGEDDTKPMESGSTAFPLEEISCLEFIRETISEGILLTFMMCVVFQYGVLSQKGHGINKIYRPEISNLQETQLHWYGCMQFTFKCHSHQSKPCM
jgi:hypothetical protein